MMTVRFPSGYWVRYNRANYAENTVHGCTDLYVSKDGTWLAQVPNDALIEYEPMCADGFARDERFSREVSHQVRELDKARRQRVARAQGDTMTTPTDELERLLAEGPLRCGYDAQDGTGPCTKGKLPERFFCAECKRRPAVAAFMREREADLRGVVDLMLRQGDQNLACILRRSGDNLIAVVVADRFLGEEEALYVDREAARAERDALRRELADTGVIVEELHKTIDSLNKSNASWFREYERYHARDIKQRETIDKLRDENTSANALIHEYIGIHDENASLTASIARVTAELELLKDKLEDSDAANATLSVQADTFRAQLLVALGELRLLLEVLRVVECEVVDGTASLPVGRAVATYRAEQAKGTPP